MYKIISIYIFFFNNFIIDKIIFRRQDTIIVKSKQILKIIKINK